MAGKGRFNNRGPARAATVRPPLPPLVKKEVIEYGKPFVLLEDKDKKTFRFANGAWVPFEKSILECRETCKVEAQPQKIKGMTRYEVRPPLA